MSNIGDGFKNIFLAGIGALAYTGEKSKEIIDQLVEKGEITLDQGRELNEELKRKATTTTQDFRDAALEAYMKAMNPDDREAFAAKAAEVAAAQNAADADVASEESVDAEVIVEEVVVEDAEAEVEAEADAEIEAEAAEAADEK